MSQFSNLQPKELEALFRDLRNKAQEAQEAQAAAEAERDAAKAELETLKKGEGAPHSGTPPKSDVRTIKDRKEYQRVKAEVLRELAKARLSGPVAPPEPKDVRSLSKADYREYKNQTMGSLRQPRK
jgi:hypothetical protein